VKNKKHNPEEELLNLLADQLRTEIDTQVLEFIRKGKEYKTKRNEGVHITYSTKDFILE
jgi:hypothetical protein